jgi:hypothetical protein
MRRWGLPSKNGDAGADLGTGGCRAAGSRRTAASADHGEHLEPGGTRHQPVAEIAERLDSLRRYAAEAIEPATGLDDLVPH